MGARVASSLPAGGAFGGCGRRDEGSSAGTPSAGRDKMEKRAVKAAGRERNGAAGAAVAIAPFRHGGEKDSDVLVKGGGEKQHKSCSRAAVKQSHMQSEWRPCPGAPG